ncbi:hypothetical protein N7512_003890 [Penicillium capsulatum]|nr:hypothetical protein N7512_003890 [Penicillium capsulatum]
MAQNSNPFWGPPPSYDASQTTGHGGDPPPYHNWQDAVPDTSQAHVFCNETPLWLPVKPSPAVYSTVQHHDLRPVRQRQYRGDLVPTGPGRWSGRTSDQNGDCLVLTHLPLYFAAADSPFLRETRATIYFEVTLRRLGPGPGAVDDSGFAIGFVAQPYPAWRSPGWERGSVGVFSDDGCRFVNDSWGGREFTSGFQIGETVGLGMILSRPEGASAKGEKKTRTCDVEIFFTRNGQRVGGWDLHEETDEEAGGVEGLEGEHDLYGAIGLFGGVQFEACFDPAGWLWRPRE